MLAGKRKELQEKMASLREAMEYIEWKQTFYDDVRSGKIPYVSHLTANDAPAWARSLAAGRRRFRHFGFRISFTPPM